METSFCELRCKEVVNVVDGRQLGNIIDMTFCTNTGRVSGFIVPGYKKGFSFFKTCEDIFIPYQNVCKIGEDVILVNLNLARRVNCLTDGMCNINDNNENSYK